MKNELFHIGPLTVYGYGTMIAIGILAAFHLIFRRAEKEGLEEDTLFSLIGASLTGGFLSAKLLYWIINWKEIAADPVFLIDTLTDGFVVMGGLIGGIAICFYFCQIKKLPFGRSLDVLLPSVALGQGFGRIGCLLAGCCYGRPAVHMPSITFHDSSFAPNGIPLIPVQIYASLLDFANCAFLLWFDSHRKANGTAKEGQTGCMYLITYSIGRFLLEFLRGDEERGFFGPLSTSQLLSLGMGIIGVILFMTRRPGRSERLDRERSNT